MQRVQALPCKQSKTNKQAVVLKMFSSRVSEVCSFEIWNLAE